MTEPDFWAQQWQHWICDDCDLTLAACRCDSEPVDEDVSDQVADFLECYSR